MNHSPIQRSFYSLATLGALIVAGGTLSLVAPARQAPPSPGQVKKSAQSAPPTKTDKKVGLPDLGQAPGPPGGSGGSVAPAAPVDPQKQISLYMGTQELDEKTGLAKGKNVVYTEGDMKFKGDTFVYNKDKRLLDTQGNLDLDDPKHHVTGDKAHVDRDKRLATITGSVIITLKPAPPDPNVPDTSDRAKQRQFPVIITCDRADDAYKKEFIVLNGHLVFKQTIRKDNGKLVDRTMTAEHAEYDGKANQLHLFQPVKAFDSEGQKSDFKEDVFIGTKEGEETLKTTGPTTILLNPDETKDEDQADAEKTNPDNKPPEKKDTPPEKKDTPPPTPKSAP